MFYKLQQSKQICIIMGQRKQQTLIKLDKDNNKF